VGLNGTFGEEGTAPKGGTTGETGTSADERQLESVSAVAEPVTRILAL
jgi:hypothetical protein